VACAHPIWRPGRARAPDCSQSQTRLGRKGSPCMGHTPPRAVRTPCREARGPRQACHTPCGAPQWARPPHPCRGWRVARARCPSPAGSPPLQVGALAVVPTVCGARHALVLPAWLPSWCHRRGGFRAVPGVAATRHGGLTEHGGGWGRPAPWGRSGAAGGRRRVAVRPRAKPGGSGVGILPGCGAHSAQTPSRCAGPGQEGRQTRGHPEGVVSSPHGP
jgi:hypothetical protein